MRARTATATVARGAALVAGAMVLGACVRPQPPTITPRTVEVTQITSTGLGLRVTITANNPNRYAIVAQAVTAHVTMAGRDLGTTQSPSGMTLPSRLDTTFSTELSVGWMDLPGLLAATVMSPTLPYHVEGTVDVGARDVRLRVPYTMDGAITRAQVLSATMSSVIPALTAPQGFPALPVLPGMMGGQGGSGGAMPALPAIPQVPGMPALPQIPGMPAMPQPPQQQQPSAPQQ